VHGNLPALHAVLDDIEHWRPDQVIVNGDLVSRGPLSLACVNLVLQRVPEGRLLRGNHERFVLSCVDQPPDPASPTYDLDRLALWTANRMGTAVDAMRTWRDHVDLSGLDGGASFHVTHGSRLGDRAGIHPETDGDELAQKLGDPRDLFVSSHTHRPFTRRFNGTLVVNTGSVGQPLDGDARASYGRFSFSNGRWTAEIARVDYERARAEQDFFSSGFMDESGPVAQLILRELREARAHIAPWRRGYLQPVKDGAITVADAIQTYLASL
jgi:predicted phosphodiesterase